jgi:hypothetical protein
MASSGFPRVASLALAAESGNRLMTVAWWNPLCAVQNRVLQDIQLGREGNVLVITVVEMTFRRQYRDRG